VSLICLPEIGHPIIRAELDKDHPPYAAPAPVCALPGPAAKI